MPSSSIASSWSIGGGGTGAAGAIASSSSSRRALSRAETDAGLLGDEIEAAEAEAETRCFLFGFFGERCDGAAALAACGEALALAAEEDAAPVLPPTSGAGSSTSARHPCDIIAAATALFVFVVSFGLAGVRLPPPPPPPALPDAPSSRPGAVSSRPARSSSSSSSLPSSPLLVSGAAAVLEAAVLAGLAGLLAGLAGKGGLLGACAGLFAGGGMVGLVAAARFVAVVGFVVGDAASSLRSTPFFCATAAARAVAAARLGSSSHCSSAPLSSSWRCSPSSYSTRWLSSMAMYSRTVPEYHFSSSSHHTLTLAPTSLCPTGLFAAAAGGAGSAAAAVGGASGFAAAGGGVGFAAGGGGAGFATAGGGAGFAAAGGGAGCLLSEDEAGAIPTGLLPALVLPLVASMAVATLFLVGKLLLIASREPLGAVGTLLAVMVMPPISSCSLATWGGGSWGSGSSQRLMNLGSTPSSTSPSSYAIS